MTRLKLLLLLISLISSPLALAEYRVFNLEISKQSKDPAQPAITRTVQSTLDPIQYRDLYHVQPDETVTYTETWMCKGRTDSILEFCPNPKAQIQELPVSNQNTP